MSRRNEVKVGLTLAQARVVERVLGKWFHDALHGEGNALSDMNAVAAARQKITERRIAVERANAASKGGA